MYIYIYEQIQEQENTEKLEWTVLVPGRKTSTVRCLENTPVFQVPRPVQYSNGVPRFLLAQYLFTRRENIRQSTK